MATSKQPTRIELLAQKWQAGTITADEKTEFDQWYNSADNILEVNTDETFDGAEHRIYQTILAKGNIKPAVVKPLWPRIAAAASILIFLSVGGYYLTHTKQALITSNAVAAILPGGNKAVLTLSGGKNISLTDARPGVIAQEGNDKIYKAADGTLSYQPNTQKNLNLIYNTITTPRGGQWSVILPDGTRVKLDAASSIKYPVAFAGKTREVTITGQAYFEVVHNAAQPFKVNVRGQVIEDIGTHFNINAYNDEPVINTTLVEGSVRITKNNRSAILRPGEQALVKPESNLITIQKVNTDDAVAWENDKLSFKNQTIQQIMRQVSRWYDVDVEYDGNLPQRTFTGGISRKSKLSDLLKVLEFNNIHCMVTDKKITVSQ